MPILFLFCLTNFVNKFKTLFSSELGLKLHKVHIACDGNGKTPKIRPKMEPNLKIRLNYFLSLLPLDGSSASNPNTTPIQIETRKKQLLPFQIHKLLSPTIPKQNFPSHSVTTLLTLFFTLGWQRRPGRLIKPFIKISWIRTVCGGGERGVKEYISLIMVPPFLFTWLDRFYSFISGCQPLTTSLLCLVELLTNARRCPFVMGLL